jgi:chromate transport protein ChrA
MLYCINLIHGGFMAAVASFLIWSLPGALGMYGLSIGVASINETLPRPVYALLSGLNAATVGVIALAAVELSNKAITDKLTRVVVFVSGAAGMLYNALWYFPVLMVVSGFATLIYDYRWLQRPLRALIKSTQRLTMPWSSHIRSVQDPRSVNVASHRSDNSESPTSRPPSIPVSELPVHAAEADAHPEPHNLNQPHSTSESEPRVIPREYRLSTSWKSGTAVIATFFLSFIAIMVVRSTGFASSPGQPPPLLYRLFANMYLAGTIIFGGGPVVVPLLREYVVAEGWVSPRDFLIGLALIQAFPGPNFNFAVFLGSLTAVNNGYPSVVGALIAWVGIFSPGLVLVHGTMGIWSAARSRRWVKSLLRGVNAGAVGLIYTAVYRIFGVGYIDEGFQAGRSLGDDPWWVVIVATSFVGGRFFGINAPMAILMGAALGLIRYGVVSA